MFDVLHSSRYPIIAVSGNQVDVQFAVDSAIIGQTVLVPSGNYTWTIGNGTTGFGGFIVGVCVRKGIKLQGGYGGDTIITFGSGFPRGGLQLFPDALSLSVNAIFEVVGFTFNGNNQSMGNEGLLSVRSSTTSILHNLKIHDNTFKNVTSKAIVVNGAVNGVIYNNIFINVGYSVSSFGGDADGWATFTRNFGQDNNLFVEDNIISFTSDIGDVGGTDHGQGSPGFVFRYNTFNLANTIGGNLFIIHGLQSMAVTAGYTAPSGCGYPDTLPSPIGSCDETVPASEQWSTIKSEYYGNKIINASALNLYMAHRGSWLMMFLNSITSTGSTPPIAYFQYSCDSSQKPSVPVYSQHVQNSYIFNNLYNGLNVAMTKGLDFCGDMSINKPYTITENVDYWNYKSSFNGTVGIGFGTLSNRPVTCTVGVGYWATDQLISNIFDYIGASPMAPINGIFYKCESSNVWTSYYIPYIYPHPLRAN